MKIKIIAKLGNATSSNAEGQSVNRQKIIIRINQLECRNNRNVREPEPNCEKRCNRSISKSSQTYLDVLTMKDPELEEQFLEMKWLRRRYTNRSLDRIVDKYLRDDENEECLFLI